MNKKILKTILIASITIIVIGLGFIYFNSIRRIIHEESSSHLTEVYNQANKSLNTFNEKNWDYLHLWTDYLKNVQDDQKVYDYLQNAKKELGFVDFYFINEGSSSITLDGLEISIDMRDSVEQLLINKEDVVFTTVIPNNPQYIVFASPATSGSFKGFNYAAIAMSYDSDSIIENIQISSFDDQTINYIIHHDGRIVLDTTKNENNIYNFFTFLKESNLTDNEIEDIQNDFINGKNGSVVLRHQGVDYYLIYLTTNTDDWMFLGMVPTKFVNERINKLQIYTIVIFSSLIIIIACGLIVIIILKNREKIKQKETLLIHREQLFAYLAMNIDDIFMMINTEDETLDYISPNIYKLLGLSTVELHNNIHEFDNILCGDESINLLDKIHSLGLEEEAIWSCEYIKKDSMVRRFYQVTAKCTNISGKEKYIVLMSDRTEERKKNQLLEQMAFEAKSANRAKSRFLSNMSHDIRTPMNAIIGFATLALANINEQDKVQDYVTKILSSSNHLLSLINDVLDMSRIESGTMKLIETECNLSDLLHNLNNIISGQINAKNLDFQISANNIQDEDVYIDKIKFNQLILNLLSNAIKYTPSGGKIDFTISQKECSEEGMALYVLNVKDTGIGMSKEFLSKIFVPFEREQNSVIDNIQGTGLGMAIAKNIVSMFNGTIDITSEVGKGTNVEVTLKLRVQSQEVKELQIVELRGLKGLVVDDDYSTCDSVTKMLTMVGMRSEWTLFGKEAILRARHAMETNDSFSVYIIDWRLPDINGIEVARQIRSIGDHTPIIILTAYDWSEIEEEARSAGVNGFCSKPMFVSDLRHALISALSNEKTKKDCPQDKIDQGLGKGKKILIVEDNLLNIEIATEILSSAGFDIQTAANGKEALDKVSISKPGDIDLILMDIQMPIMNGYEATKNIRNLKDSYQANIPIIAMTANAFDEDRDNAFAAGMNGFISKPIDVKEVFKTIDRILK